MKLKGVSLAGLFLVAVGTASTRLLTHGVAGRRLAHSVKHTTPLPLVGPSFLPTSFLVFFHFLHLLCLLLGLYGVQVCVDC